MSVPNFNDPSTSILDYWYISNWVFGIEKCIEFSYWITLHITLHSHIFEIFKCSVPNIVFHLNALFAVHLNIECQKRSVTRKILTLSSQRGAWRSWALELFKLKIQHMSVWIHKVLMIIKLNTISQLLWVGALLIVFSTLSSMLFFNVLSKLKLTTQLCMALFSVIK